MDDVIAWILPVLIGAAIGYVTNVVAIRMLFRPLAEKRIFGIRVPFTPGIIPRNRHRLAISIADTVSRELLNEAVLSERLAAPDFVASVHAAARDILDRFLDSPLGGISLKRGSLSSEGLTEILKGFLSSFAASPSFKPFLEAAAAALVEGAGKIRLGSLLEAGGETGGGAQALSDRVISALTAEGPSGLIRQKLISMLDAWLEGGRSLDDTLPLDPAEASSRVLFTLYPELLSFIAATLRDPANREALVAQGRDIVTDLLKRLNVFQRFLVQAGQYDKKILENMDQTVEELIQAAVAWAARDDTRSTVCVRAAAAIRGWTALSPEAFLRRAPGIRESLTALLDRGLAAARDGRFRDAASRALAAGIRGLGKMSLLEAAQLLLALDAGGIARLLSSAVEAKAGGEGPGRLASAVVGALSAFLEANAESSPSSLLGMGDGQRGAAAAFLGDKALGILRSRAGEVIQAMRVRDTVIAKIDSLDILSLERIVLDIMKEQFVWIDLLGGVLGGIIGLVQALLSRIL